ncbi:hypothetical protein BDZ89DRAFT_1147542 [Hymenopellis radicata]|nr:hypothetical protein BDZ89DRAFT_1147542 [Hymenopellis radicata]
MPSPPIFDAHSLPPQWLHLRHSILIVYDPTSANEDFTAHLYDDTTGNGLDEGTAYDSGDEADDEDDDEDEKNKDEHNEKKKPQTTSRKRYQACTGVSEKLKPFLAMQDRIQTIIFDHQYDKLVLEDCDCGRTGTLHSADFNAGTSSSLNCRPCATWDLRSTWDTAATPANRLSENNHRRLTIVDVNGYHKVNVVFCRCLSRIQVQNDEAEQLPHGSYVALYSRTPGDRDNLRVMDNYIMHNNTSKKSAYDYCYALQRLTDPSRPDLVSDVYRHLRLAARVMRKLASRRRSGQEHGIDKYITHRRPGSMSIFCPACPQPGFNIDLEVLAAAKEEERHKYALNLSGDGTFNCPRIKKLDDPNDDALNAGNAYVAEETKFQTYLDVCEGEPPDKCTCARLRAMKLQSLLKFVNCIVSGIFGVVCTRHVFFQDNGIVDMYGGERFCYSDRAFVGALEYQEQQRWVNFSYDIWCMYRKHLLTRITKEKFPDLPDSFWELLRKVTGGIPGMHILGHVALCRTLFNFAYMKCTGKTNYEAVEQPWANTRLVGASVKHENHGQRHDSLDSVFEDWNYNKLIKLGKSIADKYYEAVKTRETLKVAQDSKTTSTPLETLEQWLIQYDKPLPSPDCSSAINRFEVNFKGIKVPTREDFVKSLEEREKKEGLSPNPTPGFIAGVGELWEEGARLDYEQKKTALLATFVRKQNQYAEPSDIEKLRNGREVLYDNIITWLECVVAVIPLLKVELKDVSVEEPEKAFLPLPSRLDDAKCQLYHMGYSKSIEYDIRVVQAHLQLNEVREAVLIHKQAVDDKSTNITGQSALTRAKRIVIRLQLEKQDARALYNYVRGRLLRLGLNPDDLSLQPLKVEDCRVKNVAKPAELGEKRALESWIWTASKPDGLDEAGEKEWMMEVKRVLWMRGQAEGDRWREETETLEEENSRCQISHEKTGNVWMMMATDSSGGKRAYAWKQHAFYEGLRKRHETEWKRAQEKVEKFRTELRVKLEKGEVISAETREMEEKARAAHREARAAEVQAAAPKRNKRLAQELKGVKSRLLREEGGDDDGDLGDGDESEREEQPKRKKRKAASTTKARNRKAKR